VPQVARRAGEAGTTGAPATIPQRGERRAGSARRPDLRPARHARARAPSTWTPLTGGGWAPRRPCVAAR